MSAQRELRAALLLCLAGAVAVLLGVGRSWAQVDVAAGPLTPARTVEVPGADLLGGVRALGLVGLAGVVALAATRRAGRLAVGLLLLLAGAGVVTAVGGADLAGLALRAEQVAQAGGRPGPPSTTLWPWTSAVGGALVGLAGLAALVRGRRWPPLGERYERPAPSSTASRTAPALVSEAAVWAALDRGEDPTRLVSGAGSRSDEEDRR
jgi:uncharacterized membrane protein (TIGR02234 family)